MIICVDPTVTHYEILHPVSKSLHSLKIVGVPHIHNIDVCSKLFEVSKSGCLHSLKTLELKFVALQDIQLLEILSSLTNLECFITDQFLTLTLVNDIIERKHGIKFILEKISIDDTSEIIGWTNLLNELCFRVILATKLLTQCQCNTFAMTD